MAKQVRFNELRMIGGEARRVWGMAGRDVYWLVRPNGIMKLFKVEEIAEMPLVEEGPELPVEIAEMVERAFPVADAF